MNHHSVKLILASQSPRRRQLLEAAGFDFKVMAPDEEVEQAASPELPPAELVVESAKLKAEFVASQLKNGQWEDFEFVLAADTLAHCDSQVLGKPVSQADARRMLQWMSGKQHQVLTGVCLWHRPTNKYMTFLESTSLRMDPLGEEQLERYLESGGWQGKAGGFGYQDGLDWVHIEDGLASNVVGLPVERLAGWMEQLDTG